jgi:hypothetical protein
MPGAGLTGSLRETSFATDARVAGFPWPDRDQMEGQGTAVGSQTKEGAGALEAAPGAPGAAAVPGKRRFALLEGVLPIDSARVPAEVVAGVTLAALAIPEVMGYTSIAGMPLVTGLYTILLPIAVFALLGSSRHLVVGADSASAA